MRWGIQTLQRVQQRWHAGQKKRHLLCGTALWQHCGCCRPQPSAKESNSCLLTIVMRDCNNWACVWHAWLKLTMMVYWDGYARVVWMSAHTVHNRSAPAQFFGPKRFWSVVWTGYKSSVYIAYSHCSAWVHKSAAWLHWFATVTCMHVCSQVW